MSASIVVDAMGRSGRFFALTDGRLVRAGAIPEWSFVWVGSYVGDKTSLVYHCAPEVTHARRARVLAFAFSFTMGWLVFQSLTLRLPSHRTEALALSSRYDCDDWLVQLWPLDGAARWPADSAVAVGDSTIQIFASRALRLGHSPRAVPSRYRFGPAQHEAARYGILWRSMVD